MTMRFLKEVDWFYLVQGRNRFSDFLKAVMKYFFSIKC
jgi:hypothetical protein